MEAEQELHPEQQIRKGLDYFNSKYWKKRIDPERRKLVLQKRERTLKGFRISNQQMLEKQKNLEKQTTGEVVHVSDFEHDWMTVTIGDSLHYIPIRPSEYNKTRTLPEYIEKSKKQFEAHKHRYDNYASLVFEEYENQPEDCYDMTGYEIISNELSPAFIIYSATVMGIYAQHEGVDIKDFSIFFARPCELKKKKPIPFRECLNKSEIFDEQYYEAIKKDFEDEIQKAKERLNHMVFHFANNTIWYPVDTPQNSLFKLYYEMERLKRVIEYVTSDKNN
ncbi:MAG: hypothetical protein LBE13_16075 [Bacteroidales bacterium]|jgi:hypothetical protein|nr:hypothetical protein [Bacteroidales bacterium]